MITECWDSHSVQRIPMAEDEVPTMTWRTEVQNWSNRITDSKLWVEVFKRNDFESQVLWTTRNLSPPKRTESFQNFIENSNHHLLLREQNNLQIQNLDKPTIYSNAKTNWNVVFWISTFFVRTRIYFSFCQVT